MRSSFLPWMIVKIRDNELKCLLAAVISVSDQKKIIKSEEQEKEPQLNRNGNREAVIETGEGSTMPGTKIQSWEKENTEHLALPFVSVQTVWVLFSTSTKRVYTICPSYLAGLPWGQYKETSTRIYKDKQHVYANVQSAE